MLAVNVASNAPSSVTNIPIVSGGGEVNTGNDTGPDLTDIVPPAPHLTLSQNWKGLLYRGLNGSLTIAVANNGTGPTAGLIKVVDIQSSGLTATGISGSGWTCTLNTLTCTRSDPLMPASSYPQITVTFHVAKDAPSTGSSHVYVYY
jgi:hypothetical protein